MGFSCLVGLAAFSGFVGFAAVTASASLFPFPLTGLAEWAGVAGLDPSVGFEAGAAAFGFLAVGLPAVLVATPDLLFAGMLAGLLPVVMASPNVLLGFLLLFDLAFLSVLTDLSALETYRQGVVSMACHLLYRLL